MTDHPDGLPDLGETDEDLVKYAKKFDQLEIVCKMNEELEQLDSGDKGFVPVNLFKNCL